MQENTGDRCAYVVHSWAGSKSSECQGFASGSWSEEALFLASRSSIQRVSEAHSSFTTSAFGI